MRCLAVLLLAAACGAAPPVAPAPEPSPPRLVVLVVIDQLPEWAFTAKLPQLRTFAQMDHRVGRYPQGSTLTAPGHALLVTGAPPATSGVIANEWWDRDLGKIVLAADAKWLRVPTLADGAPGKVVTVSLKARAAILTAGVTGTPIWFDVPSRRFTSRAPVPWLTAPDLDARLARPWTALDPARLAALSGVRDDQPGEVGEKGFGPTFPHDPSATPSPADAVHATPLGNELVFETAAAAIAGAGLGADAVPDLLVLSLSAHDYVGHGWGHESWEAWDMTLRLDAQLAQFLDGLPPHTRVVVTSDHGASPLPETLHGGRIAFEDVAAVANRAASAALGEGTWAIVPKAPFIYVRDARAIEPVLAAVRAMPGVERAERSADFAGDCAAKPEPAASICWMIDRERAGEIVFLPARGWIMEEVDERLATAHGSLHDYDREVPVLFYPRGTAATVGTIPMTAIAPMLGRWLNVTPPKR